MLSSSAAVLGAVGLDKNCSAGEETNVGNLVLRAVGALSLVLLCLLTVPSMASERDALPVSTTYSEGVNACVACHDDQHTAAILAGPHGVAADPRTPAANRGCESCHGPGGEHARKEKEFRVAQTFGGDDPALAAEQTAVCQGCHNSGEQQHFLTSEHSRADVACHDCHAVHEREDKSLMRLTQVEVCVACHTEQKANLNKFSRHPIREGKVVCTDCHNTHGDKGPHMLVEATTNETCYLCHTEKRGPFLFEHEPVQDDCSNCHNPHGSINDSMLIARRPFLCQQCHIESRHPGTIYQTGSGITDESDITNNRLVGKSCADCHTQIHGSNHPGGMTFRR